ncbi:hypothetical protein BO79DRAFT_289498 [Aspergillus costaricaensis CBS 115574]|uniref:uncharacterized protein n=1 Tax=Aspergillus costaricaensis CBS 115574 TaxID=1448317 RepID=UPI000DBD1C6E|nr:hypothetical protein BO79DRAFT_289498 [Aspergillus costaricaensis CBS 115574]RAK85983.1 hypothetical protein BO79DRAFT_289498 [Aspergillus costaricaensis CBS 115574]
MKKTLLLVFIHGFKGDDDTFGEFPGRFCGLISRALPAVQVVATVYPKYETRGELKGCVSNFREWLQNKVIDLEVSNRTASPTVDPSVHVILLGHSMGGIVAAETLLLLASEQPIPAPSSADSATDTLVDSESAVGAQSFMFPHIQGVIAFDTPFLGIAPGVISYGAEGHYRNATTAYTAISEVAGLFGLGGNSSNKASTDQGKASNKSLPPSAPNSSSNADAAATPSWQRWGKYAMFAGAAGALAAGGAAAMYSQRDRLTDGWGWVSSHLSFVGSLARPSELRRRLALLAEVQRDRGIGCTNFYTCLGQNASDLVENKNVGTSSFSQKIIRSKNRTFCSLPAEVESSGSSQQDIRWARAVNDKAADEIKAHISMFLPNENPAFNLLVSDACKVLVESVDKGWYATATGPIEEVDGNMPRSDDDRSKDQTDSGFMDGDDVVVVE